MTVWSASLFARSCIASFTASARNFISACELVADAVDGDDVARVGGRVLDLLPQLRDVHINGARQRQPFITPDVVEQLVARDDLAAMLDEILQHLELARAEFDGLAALRRLERLEVDLNVSELHALDLLYGLRRAAQHGLDA